MKLKVKLHVQQFVFVFLLLIAVISQTFAVGTDPRLVTYEFQDAIKRIYSPDTGFKLPEPHKGRFVRLVIHRTSGMAQPGIDEFEVFGPKGKVNLALAQRGAVASASSVIAGHAIHKVEHLNDGKYGNDYSWIAASNESPWVQIKFPQPVTIARIFITRDRTGKWHDRIPEDIEVLISQDGSQWQSVARPKQPKSRTNPAFAKLMMHVIWAVTRQDESRRGREP